MRFAYFYFMKREPHRVRAVAPAHAKYWRERALRYYQGGPFGDRSGGLVTFESASSDEAGRLAADDPFVREGLLEARWVKEWLID